MITKLFNVAFMEDTFFFFILLMINAKMPVAEQSWCVFMIAKLLDVTFMQDIVILILYLVDNKC